MAKLFLLAGITAVSLSLGTCFGQAISGDLVGTISDRSAAPVPNATVEAENIATGVKRSSVSNNQGQYRITNLPAGSYNVTASAAGFSAGSLHGVAIDLTRTITANLTLQVGQVSSTVEVSEAATTIDTTTATIGNTYDARQTRDLPISSIGLGVLNLSLLNAGVSSNGGLGVGDGPSVGGQRPRNNNFTIEGVDNNNKSVTGPLAYVPNDAVAEFSLLQNQFSAEFGHSSGGQFNTVVKSGTNQLHGSVYEYFQNRNLNAVDQQNALQGIYSNPRYDQNRLGGTIGGPILKNKLFYFGNFEYNPSGQSASVAGGLLTPTAAGYSALAAIPGLNQNNLSVLKQYVAPAPVANGTVSVAGTSIPVGILPLAAPNYINLYYTVISVDYNISDKDQIRGRYIYNKRSQIDVQANLPQFFTNQPTTYYLGTFAEYHNFSPTITNEFRLGYNRYNNTVPVGPQTFPGLDQFPTIQFSELNLQLGPDQTAPQFQIQNTYQFSDSVTWVKGRHTLHFGFDGHKSIAPNSFTQRSRGEYIYTTLGQYLQDVSPDQEAQRGVGNYVYYGDQIAAYPYFNDTWRLRPNFTLNLGLRYEYTTVPYGQRLQTANAISNAPGLLIFGEPQPQKTNFAPRIGIAYSPGTNGTTSIRAGFGLSYDVIYDNIGVLAVPPQFSTTVDVSGLNIPNFLKNGGILPTASTGPLDQATARANTSAYTPDQKLPYSIQWNLGIQHVFAQNYTFEARYLGTRGVHLDVQQRINKQSLVTPSQYLPTYLQAPDQATLNNLPVTLAQFQSAFAAGANVIPAFAQAGFTNGGFVENSPIGNSTYHGLALQLNRKFSNHLLFIGAYTWSHLIDDSTADFNTTALTPRRPQDFQDMRSERATSALDRRQRLTFSAVYDLPWFQHGNALMRNTVGGWSIAPIYTYESPEYFTVQSQTDSNFNGDSAADRVIVNPAGVDATGSAVTPLKNSAGATVAYLAKNPNARYIVAGQGALANGGRNTLAGRPINSLDLNFLKTFTITERVRVQFSAQMYNAFNHPQFTPGFINRVDNPNILSNGPGSRNYVTPGNAIFNNPEAIFSSNPRGVQLALKLMF
jgi:Carboxypeptidase regulatory-like domain